jgi:hypothetical protein
MEFRGSTTLIILAIPSGKPLQADGDEISAEYVMRVRVTGQRGAYISYGDLGHPSALYR